MASAAATERAITSRAGLDPTPRIVALARAAGAADLASFPRLGRRPGRNAVPVLVAERARRVLGERVAVALPVRGPEAGGDYLEVPVRHVEGLAPEVGETEVDVELEAVDSGRALGHAKHVETGSDDIAGRHRLP